MRKEQARIFHARQLFPAFRPSCDKEGSPFGFSTSRASDTMRRGFRVCRYLGEEDRTSSLLWLLSLKGLRKARTEYSFNPELREGQNERQMFFDGIPRTYGLNPSQSLWRRITRSISVDGKAFPRSYEHGENKRSENEGQLAHSREVLECLFWPAREGRYIESKGKLRETHSRGHST